MNSPIDLSRLPAPNIIEPLDYETLLAERKARLIALYPEEERDAITELLALESEPLVKLLEENAYRELVLRQRINEAAKAVMLAYANDADLEHLGALFEVGRLITDPGEPDAMPPVPPTYETNSELRRRIQLSLDGLSTAGPAQAYVFHALSADGRVKDASVASPAPGQVVVTVLARDNGGLADAAVLEAVSQAINAEDVRPLTDQASVQAAEILDYALDATLYLYPGPDSTVVLAEARAQAEAYTTEQHQLGRDVTLSGLYAALHRPGVQRGELASPTASVTVTPQQAAHCSGITLHEGGIDE